MAMKVSCITPEKLKILHVVGAMEHGGIQNWLMQFLRTVDRERYQMDLLVHNSWPGPYDDEIRELGSRIHIGAHRSDTWRFTSDFRKVLKTQGPYEIVHSHVYSFSGYVLRLANSVPMRIAHAHNDRRVVEAKQGLARQCYQRLMKFLIKQNATLKLAASKDAAADLFGPCWRKDISVHVVHCGLSLEPFRVATDRAEMRAGLGIPADAW
jgi:hypothetical protein